MSNIQEALMKNLLLFSFFPLLDSLSFTMKREGCLASFFFSFWYTDIQTIIIYKRYASKHIINISHKQSIYTTPACKDRFTPIKLGQNLQP